MTLGITRSGHKTPRSDGGLEASLVRGTVGGFLAQESEPKRDRDRVRAGAGVQAFAGLADVGSDGLGADREPSADLVVREPVGDVPEYLCLAWRECRPLPRAERRPRQGWIDVAAARANRLQGVDEVSHRSVLENESVRAGLEDDG